MNVEIRTEPRNSLLGIFVSNFRYCVFAVQWKSEAASNHTWLDMRKKLTWGWNAVAAGDGIPARQRSRRRPSRSRLAWSICAATDCVLQRSTMYGIRL
jgi:hypothetical protein